MPITDLQLITVTGKYLKLDGTAAAGNILFTPSQVLINTVANEITYPFPFVATLDVNGQFSISLPATDDPDINPVGWAYTVTEQITGSSARRTFEMTLAYNLAGATIDMADVTPFDDFGFGGF